MKLEYKIEKHGNDYDHDDVRFFLGDEQVGFGFIAHNNEGLGLHRCPECRKENYALNVATGICSWCGFDMNKQLKELN